MASAAALAFLAPRYVEFLANQQDALREASEHHFQTVFQGPGYIYIISAMEEVSKNYYGITRINDTTGKPEFLGRETSLEAAQDTVRDWISAEKSNTFANITP